MIMNLQEQITPHFSLRDCIASQVATRWRLDNTPSSDVVLKNIEHTCQALELVWQHFGLPITIHSLYRSEQVNTMLGGSKTSAHVQGLAADFTITGISNLAICEALPAIVPEFDQVIYEFGESGWIHLGLAVSNPRGQRLTAHKSIGNKTEYIQGFKNT